MNGPTHAEFIALPDRPPDYSLVLPDVGVYPAPTEFDMGGGLTLGSDGTTVVSDYFGDGDPWMNGSGFGRISLTLRSTPPEWGLAQAVIVRTVMTESMAEWSSGRIEVRHRHGGGGEGVLSGVDQSQSSSTNNRTSRFHYGSAQSLVQHGPNGNYYREQRTLINPPEHGTRMYYALSRLPTLDPLPVNASWYTEITVAPGAVPMAYPQHIVLEGQSRIRSYEIWNEVEPTTRGQWDLRMPNAAAVSGGWPLRYGPNGGRTGGWPSRYGQ